MTEDNSILTEKILSVSGSLEDHQKSVFSSLKNVCPRLARVIPQQHQQGWTSSLSHRNPLQGGNILYIIFKFLLKHRFRILKNILLITIEFHKLGIFKKIIKQFFKVINWITVLMANCYNKQNHICIQVCVTETGPQLPAIEQATRPLSLWLISWRIFPTELYCGIATDFHHRSLSITKTHPLLHTQIRLLSSPLVSLRLSYL